MFFESIEIKHLSSTPPPPKKKLNLKINCKMNCGPYNYSRCYVLDKNTFYIYFTCGFFFFGKHNKSYFK